MWCPVFQLILGGLRFIQCELGGKWKANAREEFINRTNALLQWQWWLHSIQAARTQPWSNIVRHYVKNWTEWDYIFLAWERLVYLWFNSPDQFPLISTQGHIQCGFNLSTRYMERSSKYSRCVAPDSYPPKTKSKYEWEALYRIQIHIWLLPVS